MSEYRIKGGGRDAAESVDINQREFSMPKVTHLKPGELQRFSFKKAWGHFKTITHHRHLVMGMCFRLGMWWQGLTHDLSKYGPTEFLMGCRYYQGNRSPNNAEREAVGYSRAWLHHKGRNKHHLEYWIDYNMGEGSPMIGMKMPTKYVVEMFVDRIAASKNYAKENYNDSYPLQYYYKGHGHLIIHPESDALLESMLKMLSEQGERDTFIYIRKNILKNKH